MSKDFTHIYNSPIGKLTLASDGENLVGLWFDGDRHFCKALNPAHEENDDLPVFKQADLWLDIYFSGKEPNFTPPLSIRGSEFRKQVLRLLLTIPYGKTATYGEIADKIAKKCGIKKMSAQAVGGAVGNNPISIIIPCHRVVGKDGNLIGYGGGIARKIKLLETEHVDMAGFFVPKKGNAL